jgi:hypothetical protein
MIKVIKLTRRQIIITGQCAAVLLLGLSLSGCFLLFGPVEPIFWTVSVSPATPGVNDTLEVTVSVIRSGVDVEYSWNGSDGARGDGSETTDRRGRMTFSIPPAGIPVDQSINISVPSWGARFTQSFTHTAGAGV